jgi:hypothetical protein
MQAKTKRRERGDGTLLLRNNARGGQTWIGKWRSDGRQIMRSVGPRRSKAHPDGLTKPQAEAAFRTLRDDSTSSSTASTAIAARPAGNPAVAR